MVSGGKWTSGFFKACNWIYKLALLNLLWIMFTLIGIIAFGFFPATIASFTVVRKWLFEQKEVSLFKTFAGVFKAEIIKGNMYGFLLTAIGTLLYMDLKFFQSFDGPIYLLLSYLFICLFFVYLVMMLYAFPVYVHFRLNFFQYIKHIFLIIIISPIHSIALAALAFAVYFLMMNFPGTVPFFGISVEVFVMMGFSLRVFRRIGNKQEAMTEDNLSNSKSIEV